MFSIFVCGKEREMGSGMILNNSIVRTARGIPAAVGISSKNIGSVAEMLGPFLKELKISHKSNPLLSVDAAVEMVKLIGVDALRIREDDHSILNSPGLPHRSSATADDVLFFIENMARESERFRVGSRKNSPFASPFARAKANRKYVDTVRRFFLGFGAPRADVILHDTGTERYFDVLKFHVETDLLPKIKSMEKMLFDNFKAVVLAQRLFGRGIPHEPFTRWQKLPIQGADSKRQSLFEFLEHMDVRAQDKFPFGPIVNLAGRYVDETARTRLETLVGQVIHLNIMRDRRCLNDDLRLFGHESVGLFPFRPKKVWVKVKQLKFIPQPPRDYGYLLDTDTGEFFPDKKNNVQSIAS
jgi:hypothetical protein